MALVRTRKTLGTAGNIQLWTAFLSKPIELVDLAMLSPVCGHGWPYIELNVACSVDPASGRQAASLTGMQVLGLPQYSSHYLQLHPQASVQINLLR